MNIEVPDDFEKADAFELRKLAQQGSDLQIRALMELRDRQRRGEQEAREKRLAELGPIGAKVSVFLESATRRVGLAAFIVTLVIIGSLLLKAAGPMSEPVRRLQATQAAAAKQAATNPPPAYQPPPQAPQQPARRIAPPPWMSPDDIARDAAATRALLGEGSR